MLRMALVGLLLAILNGAALAQTDPPPVYTVTSWPDGLATVPCSAFTKAADGGWVLTGTIIVKTIGMKMTQTKFKGGREGDMLDQRCGNK
jgi:hypothetical protein